MIFRFLRSVTRNILNMSYPAFLVHITSLGSTSFYCLLILFFLLMQEFEKALLLFFGLFIMSLLSIPLRIFFFRERPEKREYEGFIQKINASSFPSNHSARIVFLFLFFIGLFPAWSFVLFFLFITLAVLFSRVVLKFHHPEDVIGGALLAVIVFEVVSRIFF